MMKEKYFEKTMTSEERLAGIKGILNRQSFVEFAHFWIACQLGPKLAPPHRNDVVTK